MNGVETVKLQDVSEYITVGFVGSMAHLFQDEGVPLLRGQNIKEYKLDLRNIKYISEDTHKKWKKSALRPGDVAIVRVGYPGTACVIPEDVGSLNAASLVIVRPNFSRLDPYFLTYLLNSSWGKRKISNLLVGSAQQVFNTKVAANLDIPNYSLSKQSNIAAILKRYDDLIENNLRRIEKLEAMARLLYRYYFEVPEVADWEQRPISELLVGHIGGGWGADEHDLSFPEPAYVIRGTDIPPARVGNTSNVPFRYHKSSNLRSRKLIPGDIIFEVSGGSKGQSLGRSLLVTEKLLSAFDNDVMCASFCKRVTPNIDIIAPEILYLSFLDAYENGEIETYSVQSTGISNFKWSEYIERVTRPVPPVEIQQEFQDKIVPIFQQISTLGIKNSNLRKARDLLLPRLMSGEIKV